MTKRKKAMTVIAEVITDRPGGRREVQGTYMLQEVVEQRPPTCEDCGGPGGGGEEGGEVGQGAVALVPTLPGGEQDFKQLRGKIQFLKVEPQNEYIEEKA